MKEEQGKLGGVLVDDSILNRIRDVLYSQHDQNTM